MWILITALVVIAIGAILFYLSRDDTVVDFAGKRVLITGGSSGIGEYMAYLFSHLGAHVILTSNQAADLERVKEHCEFPKKVDTIFMDLSNPEEAAKTTKEYLEKNPTLDVLVLNAGISQRDIFERTSFATAQKIMNINFMAYVAIVKECIPYLKKTQGRISVSGSLQGLFGNPARTMYAASKHALQGFFSSLRAELHKDGVSVTMFCPDYVRTNLSINALKGDGNNFNKTDSQIQNGMDPNECVSIMINSMYRRVPEVWICSLYFKCLIPFLRVSPSLHAKYLLSRVKVQMSTIDK